MQGGCITPLHTEHSHYNLLLLSLSGPNLLAQPDRP